MTGPKPSAGSQLEVEPAMELDDSTQMLALETLEAEAQAEVEAQMADVPVTAAEDDELAALDALEGESAPAVEEDELAALDALDAEGDAEFKPLPTLSWMRPGSPRWRRSR